MLGSPVRFIDVTYGSMTMLECQTGYIGIMKGSRTMLECPVGYIDVR
jgi:hypothetical protein